MKVIFIDKQFVVIVYLHQNIKYENRLNMVFFAIVDMPVEFVWCYPTYTLRNVIIGPWS